MCRTGKNKMEMSVCVGVQIISIFNCNVILVY